MDEPLVCVHSIFSRLELRIQSWIVIGYSGNELISDSGIGRCCNLRDPYGKEFLGIELQHVPRWVAQHDCETASREHMRELQRPVEELVAHGQCPRMRDEAGIGRRGLPAVFLQ